MTLPWAKIQANKHLYYSTRQANAAIRGWPKLMRFSSTSVYVAIAATFTMIALEAYIKNHETCTTTSLAMENRLYCGVDIAVCLQKKWNTQKTNSHRSTEDPSTSITNRSMLLSCLNHIIRATKQFSTEKVS